MKIHEASKMAIQEFSESWKNAVAAYDKHLINSERCLQSYIYHSLFNRLCEKDEQFRIYIEPRIKKTSVAVEKTKDCHIDTVVAYGESVVLAIEIKFKSRGAPKEAEVSKDLASLSHMLSSDTRIIISRIRGHEFTLKCSANTLAVFAAFYSADKELNIDDSFFARFKPSIDDHPAKRWLDLVEKKNWRARTLPHRLYLFGAKTYNYSSEDRVITECLIVQNKSCKKWGVYSAQ